MNLLCNFMSNVFQAGEIKVGIIIIMCDVDPNTVAIMYTIQLHS